ncbi:MAG TPA: LTA synthase family protein, partial [Nitrospirota bacterium]
FRRSFGALFLVVTSFAWVVTFGYFREYNEQFNRIIFNLYYDDTSAIFQTIWAHYRPIPALAVITALSWGMIGLQRRFLRKGLVYSAPHTHNRFTLISKITIVLVILSLFAIGSRGSIGRRPAQRKDAAVTKDAFLNKAVVNPYFSLRYAVQDHVQQTGAAGLDLFLPDRDVRKAARELFHKQEHSDDLDAYLLKHAKGPKGALPRHIFLVVMESYDAWPFLPRYASLGLTENLSRLAKGGLHFENFVPASDGTMQSLTAIMTGLPYPAVEINYQPTAQTPYPSSLAETFKRLGYRTRLFYGGYLSWQRFGDFAADQGVEEVYGAPHMSKGVKTYEWGVDDEYLLDFAAERVHDEQPSFNIIMTTSYHPPYNVDVQARGFPLTRPPDDVAALFDGAASLKMLGHLWYSDKCLGDFVKKAEGKLTRPLFALTGDHYGRKFINAKPDFFERSGVPFILYGREVLRGIRMPEGAAGSHIDIGRTLFELAAPKGFPYYSMGQDLLEPHEEFLGIGWFRIIGKDFILDLAGLPQFHPLPGKALPKDPPDAHALKATFDRVYGIGWWRVKQGAKL